MGQGADPDINGLHADRELTAAGVVAGWRYSTDRAGFSAVSPRISALSAVHDIRDAADDYSDWSALLATEHPAVWAWLQADATAEAARLTSMGRSISQMDILEERRQADLMG